MALLIPTWLDLAGWAGVVAATLILLGTGRLLTAGRVAPEGALIAGWGGAAFILTLWGVLTPLSLRVPAVALVVVAAAGLSLPQSRLDRAQCLSIARIGVLALPLLLVMASARPSLPDTFLNLLPNAAYLYDHAAFPADTAAPAHSFLPGAPYNMQLAAFLASLVTPGFPPAAMIGFNIILQLAAALLLARLVSHGADGRQDGPSWGAAAFGLLLVTIFNPGFVPRYHLSDYSEASVTVTLAFAGWTAARFLDRRAAGESGRAVLWQMALSLSALVNIKQDSVALAVGVITAAVLLAVLAPGPPAARSRLSSLIGLALAALPAGLLYGAWRWYVLSHFAEGELKPLPFAQWQFHAVPQILWRMTEVMVDKAFLFGAFAVVLVTLLLRLRRSIDLASRLAAMLVLVFIVYNAALVAAYVGHFPGTVGTDAHSYYRYNTHLSLLLMLALVILVRAIASERRWTIGNNRRWTGAVAMGLILVLPPALHPLLRFDLEVPQRRAWEAAAAAVTAIDDRDRVALVLPGDNGSVAPMLEGLLRTAPPRRPDIDIVPLQTLTPDTLGSLDRQGIRVALVSCRPPGSTVALPGVPSGGGARQGKRRRSAARDGVEPVHRAQRRNAHGPGADQSQREPDHPAGLRQARDRRAHGVAESRRPDGRLAQQSRRDERDVGARSRRGEGRRHGPRRG